MCCEVLEIAALGKPAGTLCRHNTGVACGIYQERPQACARWFCLWRRVDALPDGLRPDRSGILFALESRPPGPGGPEGTCIVGRSVGGLRGRDRRAVAGAFAMFTRDGSLPVWQVTNRCAVRLPARPQTFDGSTTQRGRARSRHEAAT